MVLNRSWLSPSDYADASINCFVHDLRMSSVSYTIAHCSDIHFGKIAHADVVSALIDDINAHDVDIVAVSGDLTQRARTGEFQAALAMMQRFDAPTLVVPGNHDVHPWWRPVRRLLNPLSKYKQLVSDDLTPTVTTSDIAMLGLASAHGATIKSGRLTEEALATMQSFFARHDQAFRILVVHHHFTTLSKLEAHDIVRDAPRILQAAGQAKIDLMLCGHLHISHVEPVEIAPGPHRLVVASAGTATSSRGRKSNRGANLYNIIRITDAEFLIEERRYLSKEERFERDRQTRFQRLHHRQSAPNT